jgi:DNA-binding GntR family transcriptional regulator
MKVEQRRPQIVFRPRRSIVAALSGNDVNALADLCRKHLIPTQDHYLEKVAPKTHSHLRLLSAEYTRKQSIDGPIDRSFP